jgi:uroporphyrinogen decarboxylase
MTQQLALERLPLAEPRPDAKRCMDWLMGRTRQGRTPLTEYLVDSNTILRPVVTGLLGRAWVDSGPDRASQAAYLDNFIAFWHRMGYDNVRLERGMNFPRSHLAAPDTAPGATWDRSWADQHGGAIRTWADFEAYPWPRVDDVDFFAFEYVDSHLPEGMGVIVSHGGGMYEHLSSLMSYEGLCYALHDAPDLVAALADRLGRLMEAFYSHLLDLDHISAVFPGDDMGFRTGTLVTPSALRLYTLPWHKQFAALAHQRGVPYFLHSCGNLSLIMEDLISDVCIDGKHSYEDAIIPVQDFQARYGDRIAVLGGMDVHRLTTGTPEQVRQHTRFLIETCGGRGRYAVGSGNSIPSYVPLANYLAMVDEALI